MKKIFILTILLTLTAAMTFSGCELEQNNEPTGTETESITEEESPTVAVTEPITESSTEAVSETSTKETAQTEPITEPQTEAVIEAESETAAETEYVSENVAETEYVSENVAETESKSATESATESISETESETAGISENHAPVFTMLDWNGNYVKLSDYFGKPIVLNFWASWCPPCKAEMPDFEEEYKNNSDVQFMMINCTYYDTMEDANKFLSDSGYTFPVFYDTTGIGVSTYGITGFPTTYFIASNGEVVAYKVGMLTAEELEHGLEMIK